MLNRRQMFGAASAVAAAAIVAKPALSIAKGGLSPKPVDTPVATKGVPAPVINSSPAPAAAPMAGIALPPHLIGLARQALDVHKDRIRNLDVMAIADFSAHSSKPRFHRIDLKTGAVKSILVAHGRGSDPAHTGWLQSFSNAPGSEATSQGAYVTGDTYIGKHGLSRRLIGLEADNSNALDRGIVIHSAWYVTQDMARGGGIGRSQGCFAMSAEDHAAMMEELGAGCLLLAVKA